MYKKYHQEMKTIFDGGCFLKEFGLYLVWAHPEWRVLLSGECTVF
jgi:hypothetical protein